jgi:hypothetical protein
MTGQSKNRVDPLLKNSAFGCVLVLGRWERKKIKNLQKRIELNCNLDGSK